MWKKYLKEDITKYHYLMTKTEIENYDKNKLKLLGIGMVLFLTIFLILGLKLTTFILYFVSLIFMYKLLYIVLLMKHRQHANEIVDAVPLWINSIYALIGENNIHNAIIKSLDTCPKALRYDLEKFIEKINVNSSREVYLDFLSKYDIEGFRDIMLKMYEFRNLSKEKLKYEISALNKSLGGLEKIKRERRFKNELFLVDIVATFMIGVPCLYLLFISMLLTELMM